MKTLLARKKILVGLISAVLGIIFSIVGFSKNASPAAQLQSMVSGGGLNPGTMWIVIGLVLLALGVVLIVIDVLQKKKGQKNNN